MVLLTEGWGYSPLAAAAIVSVMPVATLVARMAGRRLPDGTAVMAAGAIALAGGLAGLGLLPHAGPVWTVAPQLLIGAGIALAVPGLTNRALRGADPEGRRAAGTIAARHAGIVLGLVLLTPVFTAQLESEERAAQRAGTALILDAALPPRTKVDLAKEIGAQLERTGGRLTDLGPAFRSVTPPPGDRAAYAQLQRDIAEEVDRAATHAFSLVFLLAAALALLALVPILVGGGTIGIAAAVATGGSAALIAAYLALGGATYAPVAVADPCKPRAPTGAQANDPLQRIALSALDGAACELRVPREDLVLGLADARSRAEFAREHGVDDAALERAVRSGLDRAIAEEERAGRLSGFEAGLLRQAAGALPVSQIITALQSSTGQSVLGFLTGLLGG